MPQMYVNTRFSYQNPWQQERPRIDITRHTDHSPTPSLLIIVGLLGTLDQA